ncbi:MAG: zinc-ribbon domain-containing protein [Desulfobacterales bacterium]|jgi:DNA-directed RNA polymerase subunit RPC12/RpoP|nr:zinc-ribbon domain-containing protein [Desulfobacterales bacterium]
MSTPRPAEHPSAARPPCDPAAATTEIRPIVICEECGRKYRVLPSKIRGSAAVFTCRDCGHRIVVAKTRGLAQVETRPWPAPPPAAAEELADVPLPPDAAPDRRLGLLAVFGWVMAAAIAVAAGFFQVRSQELLEELEGLGRAAAHELARQRIEMRVAAAADALQRQLSAHPDLDRRELAGRPELRAIVAPEAGAAAWALLYGPSDSDGVWRIWLHSDPGLTGADLRALAVQVGPDFPEVFALLTGAAGGAPASGRYRVPAADGRWEHQAVACRPVVGTGYALAAAGPVEGLAGPVVRLQREAADLIREMGVSAAGLLAGTAAALALTAVLGTLRPARPVQGGGRRR